ncbi:MAG TPA: hypothetical protein VGG75_14860 [Trebonia sp.]|jgi:hypothetical protein
MSRKQRFVLTPRGEAALARLSTARTAELRREIAANQAAAGAEPEAEAEGRAMTPRIGDDGVTSRWADARAGRR